MIRRYSGVDGDGTSFSGEYIACDKCAIELPTYFFRLDQEYDEHFCIDCFLQYCVEQTKESTDHKQCECGNPYCMQEGGEELYLIKGKWLCLSCMSDFYELDVTDFL